MSKASFHTISSVCLILASLQFFGCAKSGNPADSGNRTWKLFGQTYLVGSTTPAPGVLVKCAGLSTTSGPDGSYQLPGIPEGTQIILAERSDCSGYSDTIFIAADMKYFVFLNLHTTRLSGIVSNVIDGPVPFATAKMSGVTATSDLTGRYELTGLPPGTDTLYVTQPDYISYKTVISLTSPDQQSDVILTRERVVQGTVTEDAFVSERDPSSNFSGNNLLGFSGNFNTSLPQNARNIYIKFNFPEYFRDYRVSVLSASLELSMYSSTLSGTYQTYRVISDWKRGTITYANRPLAGSSLTSGFFGNGRSGGYWSFLDLSGVTGLLTEWRANKILYGIVIQGGEPFGAVTYFYALESLGAPPRITFKVRY